jgi:malto-oligosyltrehalose trehalohydrolase
VELILEDPVALPGGATDALPAEIPMTPLADGFFTAQVPVAAGTRYFYRIDGGQRVPDPAARSQPEDIMGPSRVVDPSVYRWHDERWRGRPWSETVLYELHVGTFTPGGTFTEVADRLDHLVDLGITAVELMPLSHFPGRRNWGYDGVLPYAPDSAYGSPHELKQLIDACHARGLMVFLDVVYNHFGPEGNFLWLYARRFFTDRFQTPWGDAINFSEPMVREFFIQNALYWLVEYHIDGLRLDAVHAIYDESEEHVLTELSRRVRAQLGSERHVHLVLENDANEARFLSGGEAAFNAQWNDDFHHAAHVLLSAEAVGYYQDYADEPPRRLARSLVEGFIYQGEASAFRGGEARGEPSAHLPPTAFVNFIQNHDQVGNRAFGERLTRLAGSRDRAVLIAVQLLAPQIPLLFMGEEWATEAPFLFFCDFHDELADAVREGRRGEFAAFPEFSDPETRRQIPDPNDPETFRRSVLPWDEASAELGQAWIAFYRELLQIRQTRLVPALGAAVQEHAAADELHPEAHILRWTGVQSDAGSWMLAFNTGETAAESRLLEHTEPVYAYPDDAYSACAAGRLPSWSVYCAWYYGGST